MNIMSDNIRRMKLSIEEEFKKLSSISKPIGWVRVEHTTFGTGHIFKVVVDGELDNYDVSHIFSIFYTASQGCSVEVFVVAIDTRAHRTYAIVIPQL